MMLDQVKNLSYQMRLFGIHQACERRASEAFSQQLHPLEFLRLLLEEELLSRKDRTAKALVTKAKGLILDDLGLRNYSHEEATSLMDILEERYHKAPLIVTSQVEPQGWLKLFEDPVIGEAIVDRLIHPSQKITLKGEKSYREK